METITRRQPDLGAALRRRRKLLSKSQADMAAMTNLRQTTFPRLEREGKGTLDTLFKVLTALDLELVIRERTKLHDDILDLLG